MASPVKSTATGIPRLHAPPSKLPAPSPASHKIHSQSSALKPPATPSISHGSQSARKPALPVPSSIRKPQNVTLLAPPRLQAPSTSVPAAKRPASPTKPSLGKTPSLRPTTASSRVVQPEDVNDRLASLDAFHTATRAGAKTSLRASTCSQQSLQKPKSTARLSLSDRTVDSLARLPSTPASSRRRSSFFNPESPMQPSPSKQSVVRPASALSLRDTTSATLHASKSRPSASISRPTPAKTPGVAEPIVKPNSRRSISATIPKPIASAVKDAPRQLRPASALAMARPTSAASNASSSTSTIPGKSVRPLPSQSRNGADSDIQTRFSQTSAALRAQIARAKAEKLSTRPVLLPTSKVTPQFDLEADPFNQRQPKEDNDVLLKRIESARVNGHLNAADMQLKGLPDDIRNMYDADSMVNSGIAWHETVDLCTLILADNEIDELTDKDFPDMDPRDCESSAGMQFAGLVTLDLRGNLLQSLPIGLHRLERLTTLNLARNQLGNAVLEVISQLPALKNLTLSHNNLTGHLPRVISKLDKLESLDLSSNKLLSLPDELRDLASLRMLNISANQLSGMPMDALEGLSLVGLNASHNALVGAFLPFSVAGLASLKMLDISHNSLASLAFSDNVALSSIQTLDVSHNRMISLPDMSGWTSLCKLIAVDNKISAIPTGLTTLSNLKHADFACNDIRQLDPRIANMHSLESLLLTGNPLRSSRLGTMSLSGLKQALAQVVEPAIEEELDSSSSSFDDEAIDLRSQPDQDNKSPWKTSDAGLVNLRAKKLTDDDADGLRAFLGVNTVRDLCLARNQFTSIPFQISLAQQLRHLDMSACALGGIYMDEMINLTSLVELDLSSNSLSTFEHLSAHLCAPLLESLDVSSNSLTGKLPALRLSFPRLIRLDVRDNKIDELDAAAVSGLESLNLSGNALHHVPCEVGTSWFSEIPRA